MTQSALIRPAWTPATIALMVLGFMVFWPLGLAMLAYIIYGERLDTFKRDINKSTDNFAAQFRSKTGAARTGNVAFDDWRDAELARLHEERMKLDEMRAEFDDYSRELRRAKDQEEFDRFMAKRDSAKASQTKDNTVPRIQDED
ncbi:DUF2852 domain-containing protein [Ahrensia sp. 13_GOM-1096m]|uniref:DUF2852 domain-containing protein n=1 Tax=Ahrensia sp. 13_GOM-1096m TaxID=1380380 RepID=UPI00047EA42A|nr:DUF2852 domain-containing protein [Ahrensia sp. 13_GOM-1096m]